MLSKFFQLAKLSLCNQFKYCLNDLQCLHILGYFFKKENQFIEAKVLTIVRAVLNVWGFLFACICFFCCFLFVCLGLGFLLVCFLFGLVSSSSDVSGSLRYSGFFGIILKTDL